MKIALIGYGKMGKMIEQIARDRGHEIVSIIDIDNQQDFDSPAFQACADGKTLFWASNFSIGVAIFSAVNRYLAKIMNQFPQYDVEMEETHHVHKLDHPSGTAITLAEEIVENIDRKEAWKEDTTDKKYLRVDHIRRGEVPGIHTIRYDSDADLITITHDAHSRKGFALGAVLAAEYTKEHQGLLTISDMFKF